jgi:hypothetical protein
VRKNILRVLTLGELEAFARLGSAGFFALDHSGVSSKKSGFFYRSFKVLVDFYKGAGNRVAHGSGLSGKASAVNDNVDIELIKSVDGFEGFAASVYVTRVSAEILLYCFSVYYYFAGAFFYGTGRDGIFSASG